MRAAQKGLEMSRIHPSGTTIRLASFFENHGFDPFLSHLWFPIGPFFKTLSALRGAKVAQHGLKMGSLDLFVHPQ